MFAAKLAYYKKQDWEAFMKMIDDREKMHDTWDEWHEAFLKTKSDLTAQGLKVFEVEIDITKLDFFCKSRGIKNDGKARAHFVQL